MAHRRSHLASLAAIGIVLAGCGSDDGSSSITTSTAPVSEGAAAESPTPGSGVTVVSPEEAAATIDAAPDDLVILDIRTPKEYAEGHIDGATLIDFYRDDFAEQIAALDRDDPYVLYCRSGNRSQQARSLMAELGFTDVADVDGGIVGWQAAGLPVVAE